MASCRPGNGVAGARARTASPRLGADTGIDRLAGTTAADRMVGGGENSFQVAGTAVGTDHFHLLVFIHYQDLLVFVTVQAFEFEYGHLVLLMKIIF